MPDKSKQRIQAWRRQKIDQDKQSRLAKQGTKSDQLINNSELGVEQEGRIIAYYGANFEVLDKQGQTHHCLSRKNLPKLVCGDRILWCTAGEDMGVIVELIPRSTLLARPAYNKQLKPIAANVDQIIIVAAPKPHFDMDLINRYLIAARLTQIDPIIVFNKIDLLSQSELDHFKSSLQIYDKLQYPLLFVSTHLKHGLLPLWQQLDTKTSIFAGQSGVGKSSLIHKLLPDKDIRIGDLSQGSGLGKHTTTVTRFYPLQLGSLSGAIIDSPGIREFGLGHVSQNRIAYGFVEFEPYLGQCKFNNCTHSREPGCAIMLAVEQKQIKEQRYQSYLRIIQSLTKP